jgi:SH3 domain protein
MRKIMKYLVFICLFWWVCAGSLSAQDLYVSGITKITMRTGPGVEHKIVAMLTSGTKLETLEYQKGWSMVKTQEDRTGWVLTRFLTKDVPKTLLVKQLQKENERLVTVFEQAEEKNRALTQKMNPLWILRKNTKNWNRHLLIF